MRSKALASFGILAIALPLATGPARAQISDGVIRLGVLNDLSSVYADFQGRGSTIAAQMAAEDLGGAINGAKIEVIFADHQNKTDIGAGIARSWFERDGVDVILDIPNSAIALAVSEIARERNRVMIASGGATSELTGAKCSPNTVQWTLDTWSLPHGVAQAISAEPGRKWFFITADYSFGLDLERNAAEAVRQSGGTVVGSVRHPLGASDFSSFVLQAQASGANVVGFANAGGDLTNALKTSAEFGLNKTAKLAGLLLILNNVPALGLGSAQGLNAVSAFYWDMNDATRAWSKRFAERHPQHFMPNDMQAGVYSAIIHYAKAVQALGSDADGRAVVAKMKELPTDDPLFGKGTVRADGRKLHPMYLLETKPVAQSTGPWDVFRVAHTIPADQAFRPLAGGNCPLVK